VEFCGGTHLDNSAKTGIFHIDSEFSVAAGVRRIEAVTGKRALAEMNKFQDMLFQAAAALKVKPVDLKEKAGQMAAEARELRQTIEKLKAKEFVSEADQFLLNAKQVKGLKVVSLSRTGLTADDMRKMGDFLRDKESGVVALLAGVNDGKITLLAVCGRDAVARGVKAGEIIKAIAPICGGKGGGKPDSAMGGGSDLLKLDDALAALDDFVNEKTKD
jgi:alanyl-tRNA synthetase